MNEEIKKSVRPIYTTLQGYLAQINRKENAGAEYDQTAVEMANELKGIIEKLKNITGSDYEEFLIQPRHLPRDEFSSASTILDLEVYARKLSGLISRLYGEVFYDESNPLDGSPSTIITSSQTQSQSVDVRLVLDVQSRIDKNLQETKDEVEKNFLNEVKSKLDTVKSYSDLINLATTTATKLGLALERAMSLIT